MRCEKCQFNHQLKSVDGVCIIALLAGLNKKTNVDRDAYSCPINYIKIG